MRQITSDQLSKFLVIQEPPCVSIYLPTHRFHPDNQQDPIRFRNLLKESEKRLLQHYPEAELDELLQNFQSLAHDDDFWNHRTDGLALLGSLKRFQIFELQRPMPELVVVADSFHVKPLLRILQSADRFQILALNRHEARLFEGNRDVLDEIELADEFPPTIERALGEEPSEPHPTVASFDGAGGRGGAHGIPANHHVHGKKKDEVEVDNQQFFRAIDQAILEYHSRPTGLPLMLAALPEHHALFRKVSQNPFLMDAAIGLDSGDVATDHLRAEAWRAVEPKYQERLAKIVDQFEEARSKQLGSTDLTDIAQALIGNRVGMLLVEAGRQIPGAVDSSSGQIKFAEQADPDVDDLLDDLAELTLKMGGEVIVVPIDRMPSTSGAAATYRF